MSVLESGSRNPEQDWRCTVSAGRRLRRGFTTGTCAAAAAKAAATMLFSGEKLWRIAMSTPAGVDLDLPLEAVVVTPGFSRCAVRKDAGDDPDITGGMLLFARACRCGQPGVTLKAGPGIGRVTRPGLQVPVGQPAINPVPQKMIAEAVSAVLPAGAGVEVELSIPDGERLARKTLNPRLGIEGGLSILGTTGLVEPMSEQSYGQTLALELKALAAGGPGPAVLVTGNFGRTLALGRFGLPERRVVKIGNLVGFALDRCSELCFEKVLLIGHIGKLIKVAAGIFNTHSRVADARFEIFAARAALLGAGRETILRLKNTTTTEEMAEIIEEIGGPGWFDRLAAEIGARASAYLYDELEVGCVLFNFRRGFLGSDPAAVRILGEFD